MRKLELGVCLTTTGWKLEGVMVMVMAITLMDISIRSPPVKSLR